MKESFRTIVNEARKAGRILVVPGAHDALSAKIIEKVGFDCLFLGGFPMVGARYGVPDIGLKGFGEIYAAVNDIVGAIHLPAFVDCDDGYGDVKNTVATLHAYERLGVSAMMFEDQKWPKRCGHMIGKNVVPTEVMEQKIRAASTERMNPDTFIFARTDSRAVYDIEEALRRAERYLRAGADGLFVEAPQSSEELARVAKAFDVPQICNPLVGGRTPILSIKELEEIGFSVAVMGLDTIMHAANATDDVFDHYDRIVDDETNSRGHSAKCHDVETHFQDVEKNDRGSEHSRNSQNCNQGDLPIAKKNQQNESGQNHADHNCVARAAFRRDNQIALIVPVSNLHPIRNLLSDFAQLRFNAARDTFDLCRELFGDLEDILTNPAGPSECG